MEIDRPDIVTEVRDAVMRYEAALTGNDVETLDALFWASPRTVRYGATENLYGQDEILEFRKGRNPKGLDRTIRRIEITTFGTDFATANLEFARQGEARTGRQSQTWVRLPEGWRVVAAHVSLL